MRPSAARASASLATVALIFVAVSSRGLAQPAATISAPASSSNLVASAPTPSSSSSGGAIAPPPQRPLYVDVRPGERPEDADLRGCTDGNEWACETLRDELVKNQLVSREPYATRLRDQCERDPEPCVVEKRARALSLRDKDGPRAMWLFRQACDDGDAVSCFELSRFGTEPPEALDLVQARELRARACRGGDARGCAPIPEPAWSEDTTRYSSTFASVGLAIALPVYQDKTAYGAELSVVAYPFWRPLDSGGPALGFGVFARPMADGDGHARISGGAQINLLPIGIEVGYRHASLGDGVPAEHAVLVSPFLSLGIFGASFVWGIGVNGTTQNSFGMVSTIKIPFGIGDSSVGSFIPSFR